MKKFVKVGRDSVEPFSPIGERTSATTIGLSKSHGYKIAVVSGGRESVPRAITAGGLL